MSKYTKKITLFVFSQQVKSDELFLASSYAPPKVPCRHHFATAQCQLDSAAVNTVSALPAENQAPIITDGARTVKTSSAGDNETGYNLIYKYFANIYSKCLVVALVQTKLWHGVSS